MKTSKLTVVILVGAIALCGCATTNHDAPNPAVDIVVQWWRVETPPSTVTEFFACFGRDGMLLNQGDGNVAVTPNDPMCPVKGSPYKLVRRHGTDPAIQVGGLYFISPDETGQYVAINGRD